jgi:hypothetical protein
VSRVHVKTPCLEESAAGPDTYRDGVVVFRERDRRRLIHVDVDPSPIGWQLAMLLLFGRRQLLGDTGAVGEGRPKSGYHPPPRRGGGCELHDDDG